MACPFHDTLIKRASISNIGVFDITLVSMSLAREFGCLSIYLINNVTNIPYYLYI
ncbi:uncharacterized protein MELLADRAFT_52982 [Melampsora larici-populina 98AG31]|uniref:Uncharacterized protein n=1 Tax=Melampsora larici-populina (strain 98AG31 / pathotype 3-4-7) TaxID=747676 RepID=F4RSH8_MELLP|nr:uncharacterized protein MELLADRAFT_52982 [Melampsora larici-populina 98AG31]EGG04603.1 hypothetical protein MELLADRAFT_52982 [Melampsora larici-populina 98AG31]